MESGESRRALTFDRVLLVGFMCSGKTAVGEALADRLGWHFIDFDREVEVECGLDVRSIFREHGEPYFRKIESAVAARCLEMTGAVLASGGGWPAYAGRMEHLPPRTISIWLQVAPGEAVRRAGKEGPTRPLLQVVDPVARSEELLGAREKWYALADVALRTDDREPAALAEEIAKHVSGETI